jgi:FkbM family methyltransferase
MHENSLFLKVTRNPRIPLRLRKKIGKCLDLRPGHAFKTSLFDIAYQGKTGSHIDNKLFLYGKHEASTLRLIRRILKYYRTTRTGPLSYLDIGVNCGVHLLAGARLSDHVYGFEPWDKMVEATQSQINLNNLENVTLFNFGLSDRNEFLPYLEPAGENLGVGIFVAGTDEEQNRIQDLAGVKLSQSKSLEVKKGDDVIAQNNIQPTLIKIDTEGFEKRVLTGLKATLEKHRPAVIFELSSITRDDFQSMAELENLFPKGYCFFRILPSREQPVLQPLDLKLRCENVLAWPDTPDTIAAMMMRKSDD